MLFCFGALNFKVSAQDKGSDEIIKINTNLVSIPVVVSDRDGRYVPSLVQNDFTIYQDGKKQDISFFATEEEPLNVAILLDTSKSTQDILDDIKDAAHDFVRLLLPNDRAMVVTFDYQVTNLSPLTADRRMLNDAINNVEIGEFAGTVMRDAIQNTVNRAFANVKGRKAIILLSDGKDHGSTPTKDELLNQLEESDVLLYSVFYNTTGRRNFFNTGGRRGIFGGGFPNNNPRREARQRERQAMVNEDAISYMSQMSELTAGRFYNDEDTDLRRTFAIIADELKKQYRIGFYPGDESSSGADTVHQIKVKVSRNDVAVRARATYRIKQ